MLGRTHSRGLGSLLESAEMSNDRDEIIALLKDPRVLKLVTVVYENTGTSCEKCKDGHQKILAAMVPFEKAREENCSTCDGDGYVIKSFDELAGQPASQRT